MNNLNLSLPKINIPGLFKSRRFWVAIATCIVEIAMLAQPTLEPMREQLTTGIIGFGLWLVGSLTGEDWIRMWQVGAEKEKYQ
jgi:hypothetical protein